MTFRIPHLSVRSTLPYGRRSPWEHREATQRYQFAVLFLHASCIKWHPNTAVAKNNRTHGAAGFVARKFVICSMGSTSESPHVQHYLGVRTRFAVAAGLTPVYAESFKHIGDDHVSQSSLLAD
jgi:hypothetical protein